MPDRVPVLVTTQHRGVFFGFALRGDIERKDLIVLTNCRNCISWSSQVKGFLGLASTGPTENCRIGAMAPEVFLHDVTSLSVCTEEAANKWQAA